VTSPSVDTSCARCFDLQCSRHRLEVELARVVVENEHLRLRHRELLGRGTELLEERRSVAADRDRLRAELRRVTRALERVLGTTSDDADFDEVWDQGEVSCERARELLGETAAPALMLGGGTLGVDDG